MDELCVARDLLKHLAAGGHNSNCAVTACNCGQYAAIEAAKADALRYLRGDKAVVVICQHETEVQRLRQALADREAECKRWHEESEHWHSHYDGAMLMWKACQDELAEALAALGPGEKR